MALMVCQISRGVAPAPAIAGAVQGASGIGGWYRLLTGFECAEAKNEAVRLAMEAEYDLLLIEDDVIVPESCWFEAGRDRDEIMTCVTVNRDGSEMARYHTKHKDQLLYTGTQFVKVPLPILHHLLEEGPIFQALEHQVAEGHGGELYVIGPSPCGRGSDTHFWYRVRKLTPRPTVRVIGRCQWLLNPCNEKHNLQNPVTFKVMG